MAKEKSFPTALQEFAGLPADVREALVKALESEAPAISLSELAKRTSSGLKMKFDFLEAMLDGLAGIIPIISPDKEGELSLRQHLGQMLTKLAVPSDDSGNVEALQGHIFRLLNCERSIAITGKAQDIMWGHGLVFQRAHVITQIRPIFFSDVQLTPDNAVIVHDLRITYRVEKIEQSIQVSLDRRQLSEMIVILERALAKERSLLETGSFKFLSSGEDAND